jgi:hypothetical protein
MTYPLPVMDEARSDARNATSSAETAEKLSGGGATNSFAHHPRVQFNDLPSEGAIETE